MYYFYMHFFYLSLLTWYVKHVLVDPYSQHVPKVKLFALLTIPFVYPSWCALCIDLS